MAKRAPSSRAIAAYLTSLHIPTYRGDKWDSHLVEVILRKRHLNLTSNQPVLAYGYIVVMDENNQPYTETSIAEIAYALHDKGMDDAKIAEFLNHWCLDYLDPKRQPSLQRIAKASNVTSTQNEEHYSSEP